jgi:hypothetical protein
MPAELEDVDEKLARARRIFTLLLDGATTRELAEAEGLTVRRVQQIVAAELEKETCNPAADFKILQIARLEQALELVAAEMDRGKASAAPAYARILESLTRLTHDQIHLSTLVRNVQQVGSVREKLERLDVAREALAARRERRLAQQAQRAAKRNLAQAFENKQPEPFRDFAGDEKSTA